MQTSCSPLKFVFISIFINFFFRRTFRYQPSKFSPKKDFLYFFLKNLLLKSFPYFLKEVNNFQQTEPPPQKKISYTSGNKNPKKTFYISGNGTFQSSPRNFLTLSETKTLKKNLKFF